MWSTPERLECEVLQKSDLLTFAFHVYLWSADQWLQFDIGPPTLVTGVVTKGRGDGRKKYWVTEYRLSYSNDSRLWHFYKDEPLQDIKASLYTHTLL